MLKMGLINIVAIPSLQIRSVVHIIIILRKQPKRPDGLQGVGITALVHRLSDKAKFHRFV